MLQNPNTPRDALLAEAKHLHAVLANPAFPLFFVEDADFSSVLLGSQLGYSLSRRPKEPFEAPEILVRFWSLATESWENEVRYGAAFCTSLSPAILARLARDSSSLVRCAVAVNPRLPWPGLAALLVSPDAKVRARALTNPQLAPSFVAAYQKVAAVPLPEVEPRPLGLSLDESTMLAPLGAWVMERLAIAPDAPPAFLRALATGRRLVRSLARNPALPADCAEVLLARGACLFALARNPAAPASVLAALAGRPNVRLRRAVAAHPACPAAALGVLAEDEDTLVRRTVRARGPLSPELARLDALAGGAPSSPAELAGLLTRGPWAKEVLASHPESPPELLASLLTGDEVARCALASSPRASADQLRQLAEDPRPRVRQAAARNAALPPEVLAWCGARANTDGALLAALATRTDAPLPWEALSDLSPWRWLAGHPDCPEARRTWICEHAGRAAVRRVARRPDLPVAAHRALWGRMLHSRLGSIVSAGEASYSWFGEDSCRSITMHTRDVSAPVALWMARHPSRALRRTLACRSALLPVEVAAILLADEDAVVARRAAAHPALPVALLREAFQTWLATPRGNAEGGRAAKEIFLILRARAPWLEALRLQFSRLWWWRKG